MEEKKQKKNPTAAAVVAILMGLWFTYDGFKKLMIGNEMKTFGIGLLVCGVVLIVVAIVMLCKKPKDKGGNDGEEFNRC